MEWIRQAHTVNPSSGKRMTNIEAEERNHTVRSQTESTWKEGGKNQNKKQTYKQKTSPNQNN